MCFAPQRRTLFQHLNLQQWSEPLVFWTFWLRNVLPATTACTVSTCQLPSVVGDRQFLTRLTSECASRHNGVHFFDIWTSTSGTAYTCSASQLPKVVRDCQFFTLLTWKYSCSCSCSYSCLVVVVVAAVVVLVVVVVVVLVVVVV